MSCQWLGWVGLCCTIVSAVFKARLNKAGWLVGILGNILWLLAYPHDTLIRTTNIVFAALYLYGWMKWSGFQFAGLFALYDGWIGYFWDGKKRWLYVLPLPFTGIIIKFPEKQHGRL